MSLNKTTDWQVSADPPPPLWGLKAEVGTGTEVGDTYRDVEGLLWRSPFCPSPCLSLPPLHAPLEVTTVGLIVLRKKCGSIVERREGEMSVFLGCLAWDLSLLIAAEILSWSQQALRSEGVRQLARLWADGGVALRDDRRADNGLAGVPLEVAGGLWGTLIVGLDLGRTGRVREHPHISKAHSIAAAIEHAAADRCWRRGRVGMEDISGRLLGRVADAEVLRVLLYKVCR